MIICLQKEKTGDRAEQGHRHLLNPIPKDHPSQGPEEAPLSCTTCHLTLLNRICSITLDLLAPLRLLHFYLEHLRSTCHGSVIIITISFIIIIPTTTDNKFILICQMDPRTRLPEVWLGPQAGEARITFQDSQVAVNAVQWYNS